MIIYVSMVLYILCIGYIGKTFSIKRGVIQKYNNGTTCFFAVLVLTLPVFLIGMRTDFIDTWAYLYEFKNLPTNWVELSSDFEDSKGVGWLIYEWIIKRFITQNPNTFLMITAIIQAGAILKLYFKYSNDYPFSVLLFFLSCSFTNMMNGIRQFLAVALLLYFADWIFQKKYLKFLVVVLLAYTIHVSAIIWLPIMFVVHGKPFNKKTMLFSVLVVLAVFSVDSFTNLLEDSLEGTAYDGYTSQFASDDGSSIMHTIIAAVPVVLAYVCKDKIAEINDTKINIMINISVVCTMVSLLANFTSGILIGRMPIYFTVFNYALLPWLFNAFDKKTEKIIRTLCALGYGAFFVYYMYSTGMAYASSVLGIYV